ncbi:LOW QUALITY PROTEIN: Gag-pol Polyprotein [Phytophthora palmivora]|uniref:Gag-pol Polyprotein n=1 Tax=Phytophthora palmivora TaxID=4796 RepID=A0A2P4XVD5_9STRA|nr:LOW QUALITY PROTEIN: Gag-pol Polyprotein [Phytophthora palmivora]
MRIILERVRALLIDDDLPRQLRGECCQYVTHLTNVTTSSVQTQGVMPYENCGTARNPYVKVFGCAAYALIPEPHLNKLEARVKLCMFVGLPQNKKDYRRLNTTENRIIYSRDVTFKEDTTFLQRNQSSLVATDAALCAPSCKKIKRQNAAAVYSKALLLNEPIDLEGEHKHYTIIGLLCARYDPAPKSYKDVMRSSFSSDWYKAALPDYESQMHNKTWTLVPRPCSSKVLQWRCTFERKRDEPVVLSALSKKASSRNYIKIFSPVMLMEALQLLITLAVILDYEIEQMDVKIVFLNGALDVEIYMEQPEGFKSTDESELVCHFDKRLYGLKQAPRVWYHTFAQYVERLGFRRLVQD